MNKKTDGRAQRSGRDARSHIERNSASPVESNKKATESEGSALQMDKEARENPSKRKRDEADRMDISNTGKDEVPVGHSSSSSSSTRQMLSSSLTSVNPTSEEEEILLESSIISSKVFLPWKEGELASEKFFFKDSFVVMQHQPEHLNW
jgi:hypothetical protein